MSGTPLKFRHATKRLGGSVVSMLKFIPGGQVVAETRKIGLHAHPEPIDFGSRS